MNAHLLRFDNTKKILIFDFETFNLNLSFILNRPWQVAAMMVKGNEVLEVYDRYIKWKNCDLSISSEAAVVTKFDKSLYESKAVDSDEVFEEFYKYVEESDYVLAHNGLGFDIHLLKDWYLSKNKKCDHLALKFIDTNCIARGIKMGIAYKPDENFLEYQYKIKSKKVKGIKTTLTALGKENNIEHDYENLHNAITDIDLNRKVWNLLKFQIEL